MSNCNSLNKLRVNYNNLQVFDIQASPKQVSQYRHEFKIFKVKPELKLAIGNKDHLRGKENFNTKIQSCTLHKKYDSDYYLSTCKTEELDLPKRGNGLKIQRKRND